MNQPIERAFKLIEETKADGWERRTMSESLAKLFEHSNTAQPKFAEKALNIHGFYWGVILVTLVLALSQKGSLIYDLVIK